MLRLLIFAESQSGTGRSTPATCKHNSQSLLQLQPLSKQAGLFVINGPGVGRDARETRLTQLTARHGECRGG